MTNILSLLQTWGPYLPIFAGASIYGWKAIKFVFQLRLDLDTMQQEMTQFKTDFKDELIQIEGKFEKLEKKLDSMTSGFNDRLDKIMMHWSIPH